MLHMKIDISKENITLKDDNKIINILCSSIDKIRKRINILEDRIERLDGIRQKRHYIDNNLPIA